jgi:hypothetical protein
MFEKEIVINKIANEIIRINNKDSDEDYYNNTKDYIWCQLNAYDKFKNEQFKRNIIDLFEHSGIMLRKYIKFESISIEDEYMFKEKICEQIADKFIKDDDIKERLLIFIMVKLNEYQEYKQAMIANDIMEIFKIKE